NTIRKVTPDGVVTTLAGSAGKSGNLDGLGSAAKFSGPTGVAVDQSGNVYVADAGNFTIRKITPGGKVTTLAGSAGLQGSVDGTGANTEFYNPNGVAVDETGNVYVSDNCTIRKITQAGVVTTVAGAADGSFGSADGSGNAARFDLPLGVAVDDGGNVYVADTGNNTIRKITQGQMLAPANGSTLSSAATTFQWNGWSGISQYALWVGSTPDSYDLYAENVDANLSQTVTLPTDGRPLYVRLWSLLNGTWQYTKYNYTAFASGTSINAQLTSPSNGSTLSSAKTTFQWSAGKGVAQYALWIGSAPGKYDLYAGTEGVNLSKDVTLPTDGRPIYVQLWSMTSGTSIISGTATTSGTTVTSGSSGNPVNTLTTVTAVTSGTTLISGSSGRTWTVATTGTSLTTVTTVTCKSNSYIFTALDTRAQITSPSNNSTLLSGTATFQWSSGRGNSQYALWIGSKPDSYDLYAQNEGTNQSRTVTLPTDGRPLYVRLWSMFNGSWVYVSYVYTAYAAPSQASAKAQILDPANGSSLSSSSTTFNWSAGSGVTQYALWVGSKPDTYDLYAGIEGANLSKTVTLPTDGRTIYVRLWSMIGGVWQQYNSYVYTAIDGKAEMLTPANGSSFSSASTTFTWSAGTGVTQYALWVGSTQGKYDIYAGNEGTNTSKNVTLPTDGRPIYVQLWSMINGIWQSTKYVYTAYAAAQDSIKAQITTPANMGTLTGSSVSFNWSAGSGVTQYALWVGSKPDSYDLYAGFEKTNLSKTVTLPTDGRPIYVRLWSMIGGVWQQYNSYVYTASDVKAQMLTPAAGITLSSATTMFNWSKGSEEITQYALWIGSTPGAYDLYAGNEGTSQSKKVALPTDGRPIYVQLWSMINGEWTFNKYIYNAY
ncbi:MAG: hypothetical protein WCI40_08895, partial [Verrucomicrobiota bacterium]